MTRTPLPSADKALSVDAYYRLYVGALSIDDKQTRLVACAVILLAGRLGLRLQEIQHLREAWVNWPWGVIQIPEHDPCGCKKCWLTALDTWGRAGLEQLQDKEEMDDDLRWKNLNAERREKVTTKANVCSVENLEDILYRDRWQPKYRSSSRTVPFGWSPRITACLMTLFDTHDYINYRQFSINRVIRRAAENANGLDPDNISAHPLRATGITFWADLATNPKLLKDLAGWQSLDTSERYLRASGRITTYKVYQLAGKEGDVPPVVPSEPSSLWPVVFNPVPFQGEPFTPVGPEGDYYDYNARMGRHLEQRHDAVPLLHPLDAELPYNYAGFPDEHEINYDATKHDLPGHLTRDSDQVEINDGHPTTTITTISDLEDPHYVDPEDQADAEENRANNVRTQLTDFLSEDTISAKTPLGVLVACIGLAQSRLHKENSQHWLAGGGNPPSAERFAKGTAMYVGLVVLPAAVNYSLIF